MVDYETALESVLLQSYRLSPVQIPIVESIGKILAKPVNAPVNIPPFNKSKVDGYAVISNDVRNEKAVLEVKGFVPAGSMPEFDLTRGQAARLMAASPVPHGSDAVQKIEDVRPLVEDERVGMLNLLSH